MSDFDFPSAQAMRNATDSWVKTGVDPTVKLRLHVHGACSKVTELKELMKNAIKQGKYWCRFNDLLKSIDHNQLLKLGYKVERIPPLVIPWGEPVENKHTFISWR